MNIGLMFVHEPLSTNRQKKQKETDKLIESKLGSKNIITNFTSLDKQYIRWSYNKFF